MRKLIITLTATSVSIEDEGHTFTDDKLGLIKKEINEARDHDLQNGLFEPDDEIDDFIDIFTENSELHELFESYVELPTQIADEVDVNCMFIGFDYYIPVKYTPQFVDWF